MKKKRRTSATSWGRSAIDNALPLQAIKDEIEAALATLYGIKLLDNPRRIRGIGLNSLLRGSAPRAAKTATTKRAVAAAPARAAALEPAPSTTRGKRSRGTKRSRRRR